MGRCLTEDGGDGRCRRGDDQRPLSWESRDRHKYPHLLHWRDTGQHKAGAHTQADDTDVRGNTLLRRYRVQNTKLQHDNCGLALVTPNKIN